MGIRELQEQGFVSRLLRQQDFLSMSFEQRHAETDNRVDQLRELVDHRFDQLHNAIVVTSLVNAAQKQLESNQAHLGCIHGDVANDGRSNCHTYSSTQPQPNRKREQNSVQIARSRLRLPYWLLNRSLDVQIYRSSRSWTLNLNPRRVTDRGLFQYFKSPDTFPSLREVERMMIDGRASLYDVDIYGHNILHVSCIVSLFRATWV